MIRIGRTIGASILVTAIMCPAAWAQMKPQEHPFILWTSAEAAAIKRRIEREAWAKRRAEQLPNNPFGRLFRYQVLGDAKAGEQERKYLLSFIGAPLNAKGDTGSAGLHTDNYLSALRYDVLFPSLTPEQRQGIEETFRRHIAEDLPTWKRDPPRLGILPNLALPRRCGTLMMSVALQDEKIIRELWAAPGSFRWFIEDYLSDGQFYNEEFAKMTSLIGELLIYARGLDRLGLATLGYDFTGKNGATLERYVGSYITLGYPRVEIPGGAAAYMRVAMGDAKGGRLLRHFIVEPWYADGTGGGAEWYAANMNGRDHTGAKTDKLQTPQWFELLHARYPDKGYCYFLAHMRRPGETAYNPTLFWGLSPIKPEEVKAPPAPSYVADQRGFALLRFDESPAYWDSPAPAVALQLAQFYVHYTNDCFSLLGYQQFNRPIYSNRAISAGYNGGSWDMSVRGHCGVVVDAQMAQPIGQAPARRHFAPAVKFVSARGVPVVPLTGSGEARSSDQPRAVVGTVYSNIDLSRSLFLTGEYLFDVYALADAAGKPRDYWWIVHAPGSIVPDPAHRWEASDELQKTLYAAQWQGKLDLQPEELKFRLAKEGSEGPPEVTIRNARRTSATDGPLSIAALQTYHGKDVASSRFGAAWYDRKIGVRVSMLPTPGTTAWAFDTPEAYTPGSPRTTDDKGHRALGAEWGGVSIVVHRRAGATVFAALHEPFENGAPNATSYRRVQMTDAGLAVAIAGKTAKGQTFDDRVLLQFDRREAEAVKRIPELEKDPQVQPLTLSDDREAFTFLGHGYVRICPAAVTVTGGVNALKVAVSGTPKLIVDGQERPATVRDGVLEWKR
jgi:hypothetical protein